MIAGEMSFSSIRNSEAKFMGECRYQILAIFGTLFWPSLGRVGGF